MLVAMLRHAADFDLVHINHLHYSHSLLAYIAARLLRRPVIITPHIHVGQRSTYDVGYLKDILRGCDAVIADTSAERDFLQRNSLALSVAVCGVGLDLDGFPPLDRGEARAHFGLPDDAFVVLFLGRKVAYKGLENCLQAFDELRSSQANVRFLAVGPETDYSRRLWSRYRGLQELVVCGRVSDRERLAALAGCDVMVMPSVGEAFGIVYLEAWAYAKPVVGARISSVESLIRDGVDGFLVSPDDPSELAELLAVLAADPCLRNEVGMCGRQRLEQRYTTEHIADRVEGLYARLLRRQSTRRCSR
jgi:glycosyltransferase involved in cell wall biosynthesis